MIFAYLKMEGGLISKVFGSLFGKKDTPVQTQPTTFQTLPEFAKEAFRGSLEGIQALPQGAFAPAPLAAQTLQGISALGQQPVDIAGQFGQQLGQFQDPFEEQVVQQAIQDIQQGGQSFLSDIGAGASAAGAFGGERQGIAESTLGEALLGQIGRTSGQLRSRGFQTAADRTLRSIGAQEQLRRQQALDLIQSGGLLQQQATGVAQAPLARFQTLGETALGLAGGGGSQLRQNVGALQRIGETAGAFTGAAQNLGFKL